MVYCVPAAQWTAAPGGPAFYAYSTNRLIDTKAGVWLEAVCFEGADYVNGRSTKPGPRGVPRYVRDRSRNLRCRRPRARVPSPEPRGFGSSPR